MATIYRLPGDTDDFVSAVEEGDTKPSPTGGMVPQMVYADGTMGPLKGTEISGASFDGQGQTLGTNTTKTVTSADASPGSPWISDWDETRDLDFVRLLTVLAATDTTIAGTFTFEFSEVNTASGIGDATTAISETRPISSFSSVRDFDLVNAGKYYRVAFEPDSALGSELVFITTTLRKQDDGAFVRLADQQIEKQNAAMGQTFAYLKGFGFDGISSDFPLTDIDPNNSTSDTLGIGATFTGTYTSTKGFAGTSIFIKADVDSGSSGVKIYHSTDGVTDDREITLFYDASASPEGIIYLIPASTEYFRIEYTNNGTDAQSEFIISVKHATTPYQAPALPLNIPATDNSVAQQVKSVIEADNGSSYGNIERGANGGLDTGIVEHEVTTPLKPGDSWDITKTTISSGSATNIIASGSALANRISVEIYNADANKDIHIGTSTTQVDAGQFRTIGPGQGLTLELNEDVTIAGKAQSGSTSVEVIEVADSTLP